MRYFIDKVKTKNGKHKLLWTDEMELIDGNHKMIAREVFDPPLSFEEWEWTEEGWIEVNSSKGGNE